MTFKNAYDLPWFENRNSAHGISNCHEMCSDVFGLQLRIAVFQQHFNHFTEILVKLIERFALRMYPRETGHESNQKPSFRTFFDDGGK
jgi:hypothetical protein